MNDSSTPTPDPDDLIRGALSAEAEGVEATDALLDRTLAATAGPAVRPSRRLFAAAAVAAIAIGAGVAMARDDGKRELDISEDPTTTTTTTEAAPPEGLSDLLPTVFACDESVATSVFVEHDATEAEKAAILEVLSRDGREPLFWPSEQVRAVLLDDHGEDPAAVEIIEASEIPSGIAVVSPDPDAETELRAAVSDLPAVQQVIGTDCRDHTNVDRPVTIALVREDGWLVVIDLETGDERELHFGGDPDAPPAGQEEGGPQFIDSVDLSPDGRWVYFSTCCEPASGNTFRIPLDGGEPELVAVGAYPRVSPDARFVATGAGDFVIVTPVEGGDAATTPQLECCFSRLAWSPGGTQLAAITGVGEADEATQAVLFDWDGVSLTRADAGKPDNPGSFVSWTPSSMLVVSSGGPIDDERALAQDASYQWLLWVDEDGVVRAQRGHEASDRTPIDGLPKALVADW